MLLRGKYWRSRPLVFSLEPRCHGLCGSQKNTGQPVATLNWACWAISEPLSQASDRNRCAGSRVASWDNTGFTSPEVRPPGSAPNST